MIKKTFELTEKIIQENKRFLIYGVNEGAKKEIINKIESIFHKNTQKFNEKDILNNQNYFIENFSTQSLFENNKIILVNEASDKILKLIQEISTIHDEQTKIILNSGLLEKKSKLRNFFEKDKKSICLALYKDDEKTLLSLADKYLKENKIIISRLNLNLIINKCNGDRGILNNELEKIKFYTIKNKKINTKDLIKLINLIENHDVDELTNNFLAKNKKRVIHILNENNYTRDDCIPLIKNLLFKTKKLLNLIKIFTETKNLSLTINSSKPPIFWKDKEIISQQILKWSQSEVIALINTIFKTELEIKKNYENSINIMGNFLMRDFSETNNSF